MNRTQFWLMDAQFPKIEPYLPSNTRGKTRVEDRRVLRERLLETVLRLRPTAAILITRCSARRRPTRKTRDVPLISSETRATSPRQ